MSYGTDNVCWLRRVLTMTVEVMASYYTRQNARARAAGRDRVCGRARRDVDSSRHSFREWWHGGPGDRSRRASWLGLGKTFPIRAGTGVHAHRRSHPAPADRACGSQHRHDLVLPHAGEWVGTRAPAAGAAGPPLQGLPPSHTRPPRSTAGNIRLSRVSQNRAAVHPPHRSVSRPDAWELPRLRSRPPPAPTSWGR
jgi:hypothetical protein